MGREENGNDAHGKELCATPASRPPLTCTCRRFPRACGRQLTRGRVQFWRSSKRFSQNSGVQRVPTCPNSKKWRAQVPGKNGSSCRTRIRVKTYIQQHTGSPMAPKTTKSSRKPENGLQMDRRFPSALYLRWVRTSPLCTRWKSETLRSLTMPATFVLKGVRSPRT